MLKNGVVPIVSVNIANCFWPQVFHKNLKILCVDEIGYEVNIYLLLAERRWGSSARVAPVFMYTSHFTGGDTNTIRHLSNCKRFEKKEMKITKAKE